MDSLRTIWKSFSFFFTRSVISTSTVVLNLLPYWSVTVIGNVLVPNVVSTVAEIVTAWSSGSIGISLLPPSEETSILALATSSF